MIVFIGHKHLYTNGVLHRDVSPGNILIEWCPGSEADKPSISGRLIDLDRGKRGKLSEGNANAPVNDDLDPVVLHWCSLRNVDTQVARQAIEFIPVLEDESGPAIMYISSAVQHALKFRYLMEGQICTPQDLRWKQVLSYHCRCFYF